MSDFNGSAAPETLAGTPDNDVLQGFAGADTLDGGAGYDLARYDGDAAAGGSRGIEARLDLGYIVDGFGDTDTVIGVERVRGTDFDDVFYGDAARNRFYGGKGVDYYNGADGNDMVDFDHPDLVHGIEVNLKSGLVIDDGFGNRDEISTIEEIRGTNFDDIFIGDWEDNIFRGYDGVDSFNGDYGFNTVNFGWAGETGAAHVDLGAGWILDDGFGNVERAENIQSLVGTRFDDTLLGTDGANDFEGWWGDDLIDGRGGLDTVYYGYDEGFEGVDIDLATGVAHDGIGGVDTLISIERVEATDFADIVRGGEGADTLIGRGGDDTLDGRGGRDRVAFAPDRLGVLNGVTVDLGAGTATDRYGDVDLLISIEEVEGTSSADDISGGDGDDWLYGAAGDDALFGGGGDDTLIGGAGSDDIDGGDGDGDVLAFVLSPGWYDANNEYAGVGVTVDLDAGTATDPWGDVDTVRNVEIVEGTRYADRLTASDAGTTFIGGAGADIITGGAGRDTVRYDSSGWDGVNVDLASGVGYDEWGDPDLLSGIEDVIGGAGSDTLRGDDGANRLVGGGGNDRIDGRGGDDTLVAGGESSGSTQTALNGGAGSDTFEILGAPAAWSMTWIEDFTDRDVIFFPDVSLEKFEISYSSYGFDKHSAYVPESAPWTTNNDETKYTPVIWGRLNKHADEDTFVIIGDYVGQTFHVLETDNGVRITVDPATDDTLTGGDGWEHLEGGAGDDRLVAGAGGGWLAGGRGADTLVGDGGDGNAAIADYSGDAELGGHLGATVDLAAGTATDGFGDVDALVGIGGAVGTRYADEMRGGDFGATEKVFYGLAGDDTLIGDPDAEHIADHRRDAEFGGMQGIHVNLPEGHVIDGFGDTDTIVDIKTFEGTDFADRFEGDAGERFFHGHGGDDTIIGGAGEEFFSGGPGADHIDGGDDGWNQISYHDDDNMQGIVADLAAGVIVDGHGDTDTVARIRAVRGTRFGDEMRGDDMRNVFRGLAGADTLDGRGGGDQVRYDRDHSYGGQGAAVVDLAAGTARDGFGFIDTLISIENAMGSAFADRLTGDDGSNTLIGLAGADTLIGGGGRDTVRYDSDPDGGGGAGIVVDLVAGTIIDTFGDVDVVSEIERIIGTNQADVFKGGPEGDYFAGMRGADSYDGGVDDQLDFVDYGWHEEAGSGGVDVDLGAGRARDPFGTEQRLVRIEGIGGTHVDDTLRGGAEDEWLEGLAGDDVFDGRDGDDTLVGGAGADTLTGGAGADIFRGAPGEFDGDRILDFATEDVILAIGASLQDKTLRLEAVVGGALLAFSSGESLMLEGVDPDAALLLAPSPDGVRISLGAPVDEAPPEPQPGPQPVPPDDPEPAPAPKPEPGPQPAPQPAPAPPPAPPPAPKPAPEASEISDRLGGTPANDTISALGGDDIVKTGDGDDDIDLGDGDDLVLAGNGDDTIRGGDGNDIIKPGRGDDEMDGGSGDDILVGFRGDEVLIGGEGNDTLLGNLDDDTLIGGAGDDRMQGGPGRDVFVFDTPEFGHDRIVLDFRPGSDTLDFTGSGLTRGDLVFSEVSGKVKIDVIGHDSSIVLDSSRTGDLTIAQFNDDTLIF